MQPSLELEEITTREKEYLDLLQRTQADFINYKHRVEREREEQAKFAKADLILKLLPILDDFNRAQEAMPPEISEADWARGIEVIRRKLMALLEGEGVIKIEAEGKDFDPREHEALSCEESDKYEEGKVKTVFSNGYRLNGRVIRPAQVAVSKGKVIRARISPKKRKQERRKSWQRY
jgi:molecular chaperone GrpE